MTDSFIVGESHIQETDNKIDKILKDTQELEKEIKELEKQEIVTKEKEEIQETTIEEPLQYERSFSEAESDMQVIENSSDLKQVLDHLYKDGNILELTDLTLGEINKFSILFTYSTIFGFRELRSLILNNLQMRVSKTRKGRDESVKIAQAHIQRDIELAKIQNMDGRQRRG